MSTPQDNIIETLESEIERLKLEIFELKGELKITKSQLKEASNELQKQQGFYDIITIPKLYVFESRRRYITLEFSNRFFS